MGSGWSTDLLFGIISSGDESGSDHAMLWMYLMPLNCILKMVMAFILCIFHHHWKKKKIDTLNWYRRSSSHTVSKERHHCTNERRSFQMQYTLYWWKTVGVHEHAFRPWTAFEQHSGNCEYKLWPHSVSFISLQGWNQSEVLFSHTELLWLANQKVL